ncbi:MAG TPA: lamin tail domain-containing protein, partial [Verrucomicrobiae bacterium]|nr:lamin tail domain-containing protein [Verrucomicrobiae bacterium]
MIKSFLVAGLAVSGAFALSLRAEQVVIGEIMYHPRGIPPEFIEVYNNTATPFDIVQWRLTGGANYEFPAFAPANPQAGFLKPFERIVLSGADEATTRASYGIPASIRIFGPWVGNLSNDGERITLHDKNGVIVCTVQYNDRGKWSPAADGAGHSLVLRSPNRSVDDWRNWIASNQPGGTPGDGAEPGQDSLAGLLKLNEIHFSSSNTVDWVELCNTGNTVLALDGLFLSARRDFADRMPLSGSLAAKAFATWNVSFPLDDSEVTIYLINSSNTVLDGRVFTQAIGRNSHETHPDGSPEWYSSPTDTRNAANNPARNTDIVINEIMFDPPSDQLDGEFIELHNRGASAVDVSGWSFSDGPNFTLPPGTTIPAGGYLVCAANATRMQAIYGNIPVTGDFQGRLRNRGELIRLVDQFGNLVDEVDYRFGGDWPDLTQGNGSSMELVNPGMDNSLPSAWRDSDESSKGRFKTYTVTETYRQLNTLGGVTDYKELHFHLAGDGYVILQNIALRQNGTGPNLIVNGAIQSTTGSGAAGWLCQGTHWASFVSNGQLHLISDGHGDNKANRVEIDVTNLVANTSVTLTFDARWVSGTPRLIAQTWDHSVGSALRLEVPENIGTPGAPNSRFQTAVPPQLDQLSHNPAVPRSTDDVRVTARVASLSPISSVQLFHRIDNSNANGAWSSKPMFDDGVSGGDALARDGIYTATLTEHKVNGRIVQFYVRAAAQNGQESRLPKQGAGRPALYVVDDRGITRDLRTARFVVSTYDLDAIANGGVAKHSYRFPRLSNSYKNMTFISNEDEIFYGGEIRNSGSPWTRGGDLSRGKWKLPEDRRFRGHQKFYYDNDPTAGRMHHNRITRYWLYLLGHPVNENEFIRVIVNTGSASIREDTEPLGNDLLDRLFENGSSGELYRIDDEWWFRDDWMRNYRNADWSYKNSENSVRYHSEWMKRTMEDDYDYSALINLFRTAASPSTYTQAQIERLVDAEAVLKMSAVRGYIGDWDSFTLNRGKNGYMYRRWSDGKF